MANCARSGRGILARPFADEPPAQLPAALHVKVRLARSANDNSPVKQGGYFQNSSVVRRQSSQTSTCSTSEEGSGGEDESNGTDLTYIDDFFSHGSDGPFPPQSLRRLRPPQKPGAPRCGASKADGPRGRERNPSIDSARSGGVVPMVPIHLIKKKKYSGPVYRTGPPPSKQEPDTSDSNFDSGSDLGELPTPATPERACSIDQKSGASKESRTQDGKQAGSSSSWSSFVAWARPRSQKKAKISTEDLNSNHSSVSLLSGDWHGAPSRGASPESPVLPNKKSIERFMSNQSKASLCSNDWPQTPRTLSLLKSNSNI